MKISNALKFLLIVMIGSFTQLAFADDASSVEEIAGIIAGMNHFPSDADKAALMAIAEDESLVQGVRDMATTVANIQHFPNDEGKAAMATIIASAEAPERAKVLAGVISNFAHMVGDADKAKLAELF